MSSITFGQHCNRPLLTTQHIICLSKALNLHAKQPAQAEMRKNQDTTATATANILAAITKFLKQYHFVRRLSQVSSYLLEFVIASVFVVLFSFSIFYVFVASCCCTYIKYPSILSDLSFSIQLALVWNLCKSCLFINTAKCWRHSTYKNKSNNIHLAH